MILFYFINFIILFSIEWVVYDLYSGLYSIFWKLYDNYIGEDIIYGYDDILV